MTREEAIAYGKRVIGLGLNDETQAFCELAIQALSQEPCDDVVSRQAVLDGIEELKQSPWATDKRGNGFEYLITEALDIVADLCVKQAPSVRPQEPQESETWNGIHAQITAPKGTFERIFNEADDDNDI